MQQPSLNTAQAIADIKQRLQPGQKLVFVAGNFNVLHPGHIRLLRFARENGDFLVVGIFTDQYGQGIHVPENLRLEGVQALDSVNYAFLLDDAPDLVVEQLHPHIVVKGKEHEQAYNPEAKILHSYGGQLVFGSGEMRFTSLNLLHSELQINPSNIVKPRDFLRRHKLAPGDLIKIIQGFSNLKVMVIGDLIIDEYINCDPLGMSQEDPTIVVTPLFSEKFIGGAGTVAAHSAGLGAQVHYFGAVGTGDLADYINSKFKEYRVEAHLFHDDSRPTTLKQRFRAYGKTLLRVSHLRQHSISKEVQLSMLEQISKFLPEQDLVIFSDFSYGCLPQELVDDITKLCREHGVRMAADSQSSSQIGDIARFKGMTLVTPTEREARLALNDLSSGLVVLAEKLRKQTDSENVFLTLGAEGLMIHAFHPHDQWVTDLLPSMNNAPKDVSGAGDSLLTVSSMCLAQGHSIWAAAYLGDLAAACQISRIGNIPLRQLDLIQELEME